VENRIRKQQGKRWNRDLFENHLMGYTLRSDRYRLVVWLDYRDVEAEPFYVELYDHRKDPTETRNIAHKLPSKAQELLRKLRDSGIGERE
jgi:iduronate 2-sulfatase